MDRFPCDAEARNEKVIERIDARTKAIRDDIRACRVSTTERVLDRMDDIDCERDEARTILRRAVFGGSAAVGMDRMAKVEFAIFSEAEKLAESDVADMERRRVESANDNRIGMVECDWMMHL